MRRFWQAVAVAPAEGGFTVTLDGKPVRTPARRALVLRSAALADAIAGEWRAQDKTVDLKAMPLTRLSATALDRVAVARADSERQLLAFAGTDLVCYRAEEPAALVARQQEAWQGLLDWLDAAHGARLAVTAGVVPVAQPDAALAAIGRALARLDAFELTALHIAAAAAGSLVIALALAAGAVDVETAIAAAELDEAFQAEEWGLDEEADARRRAVADDLRLAARFLVLHRAG
ncbi:MAG: ATP12 family chaperone protein [Alphaproteobacteria bacterium]